MTAPSKLRLSEKIGYSAGEIGGSGFWQITMIFLPAFYTDVFGLPAALAGTMFLVVRIIDAISDPVMGLLADRTHSRWGKFRPYLLWSAVPFGIGAFAVFAAPPFTATGRAVYAYATYIAMMLVYTAAMIPFSALSGVMTADGNERTSVNSIRFIGAFGGSLLVQALVQPSVKWLGGGDPAAGYRGTMAIFGVVAVVMFLVAFRSTRERVEPAPTAGRSSVARDLADLMHNRPWMVILGVTLISLVYISIRSAAQVYYFKYAVGNESLLPSFMVSGTAAILVAIALTGPLTRTFGKKPLYIGCLGLSGLTSLGFAWVDPKSTALLFALQIASSFANGPTMPLLWSMMADAADYSEWRTGRRATGLVFSASTFATKMGGALGGAVAMYVLAVSGYQANVAQTPGVLAGLRNMMGLYPALGTGVSVAILSAYSLTAERMGQIGRELAARRASAAPVAA